MMVMLVLLFKAVVLEHEMLLIDVSLMADAWRVLIDVSIMEEDWKYQKRVFYTYRHLVSMFRKGLSLVSFSNDRRIKTNPLKDVKKAVGTEY